MNAVLEDLMKQTELAVKDRSEHWLSASPETMDKAYPYLFPSLIILLHHKVLNDQSSAETLQLIDDFDFNGEWAEQPSALLDSCEEFSPHQYPEVVTKAYHFIMGKHEEKVLEQLSNIGDLKRKQLKKLLPIMATLLLSSLGKWVEEEQADEKEFRNFMNTQYEEASRETPSKILENLKIEDQNKGTEENAAPVFHIPSFKPLLYWIPIALLLTILLVWIQDPDLNFSKFWGSVSADFSSTTQEVEEKSIWRLPNGEQLQIDISDPFIQILDYKVGNHADSTQVFYLRHVPLADSTIPTYYLNVMGYIQQLSNAYPKQSFHITMYIRFLEGENISLPLLEQYIDQIESGLSEVLREGRLTYELETLKTDLWSPDFPAGSESKEMDWELVLK